LDDPPLLEVAGVVVGATVVGVVDGVAPWGTVVGAALPA